MTVDSGRENFPVMHLAVFCLEETEKRVQIDTILDTVWWEVCDSKEMCNQLQQKKR